jgi:diaminohydroxyphosphoribosylaminopyrimidine deaminase/5-amino-6-(5-phosphoribosylamino)uracil reductase
MNDAPHRTARPAWTAEDEQRMREALELAELARGRTSPNPLVGCVLVRDGAVVGRGFHAQAGAAHAEAAALKDAGDAARGATAYVTLEPCNHHGRTPPCSEALINAGVSRVVIATQDPNAQAAGGAQRLRDAGVTVEVGLLGRESERQNEAFLTSVRRGRPFVHFKSAMTLDGKIASGSGDARWVTGETARAWVHALRSESDAVVVGMGTVRQDDPALTARMPQGRTPLKVVFDARGGLEATARLFEPHEGEDASVHVMTTAAAPASARDAWRAAGAQVHLLEGDGGRPAVTAALEMLQRLEVRSVLLESGGRLAASFLQAGAIDRISIVVAPKLIGGSASTPFEGVGANRMADAWGVRDLTVTTLGDDLLLQGTPDLNQEAS